MKRVIFILALVITFASCEKEAPLPPKNQNNTNNNGNGTVTYDKELYVNLSLNVLEHLDSIKYTVETGVTTTIYPDSTDFEFYSDNWNGLQADDWYLIKIGTNCAFNQGSCIIYASVPSLGGAYPYMGYYASVELIHNGNPNYYGPINLGSNWTSNFNGVFAVNY